MPASPDVSPAAIAVGDDGTIHSQTYGDIYHSRSGAIEQARHVFLAGNRLLGDEARWQHRDSFVILETGFGIGLNFLVTWRAWIESGAQGQLHFVSIEQHPFEVTQLTTLLAAYPGLADLSVQLLERIPEPMAGYHRLHWPHNRVCLTLIYGDAATALSTLCLSADALYLDGFSPAKNPAMWSPRLLGAISRLSHTDTTLATWCVAGEVRRQLSYHGWVLEKCAGFASKREMLRGVLPRQPRRTSTSLPKPASEKPVREAIVIGAGMAGCNISERLCQRGWQVHLVDRQSAPAMETSGNHAGILLPRLALDDALAARLARQAFFYTLHTLARLNDPTLRWDACGVLQIAENAADEQYQLAVLARNRLPASFVQHVNRKEASQLVGIAVEQGGWWFPQGAWVSPASLCRRLLASAGENLHPHFGKSVTRVARTASQWQLFDQNDKVLIQAPHLILANAQSANTLLNSVNRDSLPLEAIRGQVSYLPQGCFADLQQVICGAAYITPPAGQFACVGATFDHSDTFKSLRADDHHRNLAALATMLPTETELAGISVEQLDGRVGFRSMSRDKLPLVGTLHETDTEISSASTLENLPRTEGLHTLLGLGARGLLWASLAAELLACQLNGDPLPLDRAMRDALDPARFHLRTGRSRSPS